MGSDTRDLSEANTNIAIDGPAGCGKSTVAAQVAKRLRLVLLNSGSIFRGLTAHTLHAGLDPDGENFDELVVRLAQTAISTLTFVDGCVSGIMGYGLSTTDLHAPSIENLVARLGANSGVRELVVPVQRRLARQSGLVIEGRDVGTVVFPDAQVKIYLTADEGERARRRGVPVEELHRRDEADATRHASPLITPDEAIMRGYTVIDTTHPDVPAVAGVICELVSMGDRPATVDFDPDGTIRKYQFV